MFGPENTLHLCQPSLTAACAVEKKCFAWVKLSKKRVSKRQHTFERQAPHGFRRVDPTNFAFQDVFEERESLEPLRSPRSRSRTPEKGERHPTRSRIEICVFETVSLRLAEEQRWEGTKSEQKTKAVRTFPGKQSPVA